MYFKVEIPSEEANFSTYHLLFIDDLKLLAYNEETLSHMLNETDEFFKAVGLEMNKDKSAINAECCADKTRLLEKHEGYKYLGLIEGSTGSILKENTDKIIETLEKESNPYALHDSMQKK